jgi:hypothetical protein
VNDAVRGADIRLNDLGVVDRDSAMGLDRHFLVSMGSSSLGLASTPSDLRL